MKQNYAILCGSAPKGFIQKKINAMYDYLTKKTGNNYRPENIVMFPNGINELFLEGVIDEAFNNATGVFLYLCVQKKSDLNAELSDSAIPGIEVVKLGKEEIRKDVICYYQDDFAKKIDIQMHVEYAVDGELINEKDLGFEYVPREEG